MSFLSPEFIVLLIVTVILYYFIPRHRGRIFLLAVANIVFYASAGLSVLLIFIGMCLLTYYSGIIIANNKKSKLTLIVSICVLVANLAFFKYISFYFAGLFDIHLLSEVYIPLGISFYTFQMISYLVDVYRKKLKPCKSIVTFWVYIAFFGQLVAGPIMRGSDLIPQIENKHLINYRSFEIAICLIILGFFKKIVIADSLAVYVDGLVKQVELITAIQSVKLAWFFGFQIYYDFSAYTDIALGIGYLFGIKLMNNFKAPYLCSDPTDFWKRWHISLSNWVRDYIYFPLGGSKNGKVNTLLAILLTWSIMGLWHGATLNFTVWGLYNGLLVLISKKFNLYLDKIYQTNRKVLQIIKSLMAPVWLYFIMIGFILFRIHDIFLASTTFVKSLTFNDFYFDINAVGIITFGMLLHYIESVFKESSPLKTLWLEKLPYPIKGLVYYLVILIVIYFIKETPNAFIYFQF